MKKFVAMVMVICAMMGIANANAITVNRYDVDEVIGLEDCDRLQEFINEGVDLMMVLALDREVDGQQFERIVIRYNDEDPYYSECYFVGYDEWGFVVADSQCYLDPALNTASRKNNELLIKQMIKFLNEITDEEVDELDLYVETKMTGSAE